MKKKLLIIFIIFTSCFNKENSNRINVKDSLFFDYYGEKESILGDGNIDFRCSPINTFNISNKIIVGIYDRLGFKITSLKFDVSIITSFNYSYLFYIPKYDSISFDEKIINDALHYNDIDWMFTVKLSKQFFNVFKLKENDSIIINNLKDSVGIKRLEKIVNYLPDFYNFNLNNKESLELIKKLFILTQILPLNNVYYNLNDPLYIYFDMWNIDNVKEIVELKDFESVLDKINKTSKLTEYWDSCNNEFLRSKISLIEIDYKNDNVFYFYTIPDKKLFRLQIDIVNNKIKLRKDYINYQYIWYSPKFGLPNMNLYFKL